VLVSSAIRKVSRHPFRRCMLADLFFSDLRAELDRLPKPGELMYSGERTMLPARVIGVDDPEGEVRLMGSNERLPIGDVMWHYVTQVALRRTLNRVHTSLYGPKNSGINLKSLPFAPNFLTTWNRQRETKIERPELGG
jgi:hypothetical protein